MQLKKVDLNDICRDLGIRHVPYTKYWTELPPEADQTEGMAFFRDRDGVPIILYDDRKPPNRIRFTAAHELGHLILGHVKGELAEHLKERWSQISYPRMEVEADLFAAVLLAYDFLCQYGSLAENEEEVKNDEQLKAEKPRRFSNVRARENPELY